MESKHTAGKWTAGKTNNFEYIDIDCDGNHITSVYTGIESNPEAEANAKLIAAAPALLEALIEAQKLVEIARNYMPTSIRNSDKFAFENINANYICLAIHKATN